MALNKIPSFAMGNGRIFLQPNGPGPGNPVSYFACGKMAGITKAEGDVTGLYCPDPATAERFVRVGKVRGAESLPTTSMTQRLGKVNELLQWKCPFNVYVKYGGPCKDLTDRHRGWEMELGLQNAEITSRSTDDLTAMNPDENKAVMVSADLTAEAFWQVGTMTFAERAAAQATNEVVGVVSCDTDECNNCGTATEGCQKFYAVATNRTGSPGLPAELIYTLDEGKTWYDEDITSLAASEGANGLACVSSNVIVISNDSVSLHYADKSDLTTWTEVATGFVAAKGPKAIWSEDASHTWIVGTGGYVYFTDDPLAGVEVQDAGVATSQNLNDVHFLNTDFGVAVGAANAVIKTDNSGANWAAVTGPSPAVALNAIWVKSELTWLIGTAGGKLFYTTDGGATWIEKLFPNSGAGQVRDIYFVDETHGFMAHDKATPAGRILRTTDGGYSWYVIPEGTSGTITANDKINAVAACKPDVVVGVGLADDAIDGVIVVAG